MACCFKMPDFEDPEPLIIDVHKVFRDAAWMNFKYSFSALTRRFLKRKNYVIEVPDNFLVFTEIEQKITSTKGIKTTPSDTNNATSNGNNTAPNMQPSGRASNPESVSLDTNFCNDTAQKQTYQFRFSKSRTTKIEYTFHKGFSLGANAKFNIGAPKILSDGGLELEAEMTYEVTKTKGQAFEETMEIEATSDISVGPKSNYVARVQMEERSIQADFQVRTRMSLPQGRIPINIKRKKDDTLVFVYNERNLKDIFGDQIMCQKVEKNGKKAADEIDFIIEGTFKGSLSMDHRINLTSDETEAEKKSAKQRYLQDD